MAKKVKSGRRQQLRESFIEGEPHSYTDGALLELLLTYAIPQKKLESLSQSLLDEFGDIDSVLDADFETLCEFAGIKSYTATLLKLTNFLRTTQQVRGPPDEPTTKPSAQQTFGGLEPAKRTGSELIQKKRRTKSKSLVFTNAVLKETIEILPRLPDTEDLDEIRQFVQENLPFSAETTRNRYTSYVINRAFPDGRADCALRAFAMKYPGSQELRNVCFYRFCKAEPLMCSVSEDLIIPKIGSGSLERKQLRDYLSQRYPESKSIQKCATAVVKALDDAGIVRSDRREIHVSYRNVSLPSLAFVIHSEFPKPGMYDIAKLFENQAVRALLWNPEGLISSLYELRNRGVISKISEIDNIRQFTTRYTLDEAVEILTKGVVD